MAIQTGLEGKPWRVSALAGLAIGALLFAAGYWFVVRSQKEEIGAQQQRLAALEQQIQRGQAAARDLPRFRAEVEQLDLQLQKLLRILPARRNTPDLMRRIRERAEQGNLDLLLFRPGSSVEQDFYTEWPIAIQVDGTYHNLGLFFDRVSHLPRIVNVDDMQVTAIRDQRGGGRHTIQASFTAKTFIYKETAPDEPGSDGQPVPGPGGGSPQGGTR